MTVHDHGSIQVSLVCQNTLAREGLKRILDEDDFEVASTYACGRHILEEADATFDGIIIIDHDSVDVLEALQTKFPSAHIVLLTDGFNFEEMLDVLRGGADGYILNDVDCASLMGSLRLVMLGEKVLPSELIHHLPQHNILLHGAASQSVESVGMLSEREIETLRCLVLGHPNKVIANKLDISEATVKVHVKAILRKLMVQNRTQAAIWAVNNGLGLAAPTDKAIGSGFRPEGIATA